MCLPRITPEQREKVRRKFGGRCGYCGNGLGYLWHVDHQVPVRRTWRDDEMEALGHTRGSNEEENWMPACTRCNQRKGTLSVEEFRGLIRASVKQAMENTNVRLAVDFKLLRAARVPRVKFHFEEAPE